MLKKLTLVCLFLFGVFSVSAQEKTDREKSGLIGYVKSIREETAEIIIKNSKPVERSRKLERTNSYDVPGKKLTYYAFTDEEKILFGDTYFYDESGRLVETKTEHSQFVYLCDKKTYIYSADGKLAENICHLTDRGIIGKTVYRYDSNGKLSEEERFAIVEAKLYFSRHSLTKYKYKTNGELDEVSNFVKENGEWKPDNQSLSEFKSDYFSNEKTQSSTELRYDKDGNLKFVITSFDDEKGNELETITYFADGSIKEGNRYEYQYDKQGNIIKETEYEWITEDGKSFFQPSEVTYYKIEYFTEKEIKDFEAKNKPPSNPQKNQTLQNTDREEYAVYNTLFEQWTVRQEIKSIVVKKFTAANSFGDEKPLTIDSFLRPRTEKSPLESTLVDDYNEKNYRRSSELLEDLFVEKSKIILVGDAEVKEVFNEGCTEGWKKFREKYPNSQGLTTVSRVGFNKEKTQAIVYLGHSFDCLGGAGHLVTLTKQSDGWKIVNSAMLWIS